jgi:hypothetical protein
MTFGLLVIIRPFQPLTIRVRLITELHANSRGIRFLENICCGLTNINRIRLLGQIQNVPRLALFATKDVHITCVRTVT